MIKRDELKGPSCLTNAQDDEPLFVLRANDELAPSIVRQWAGSYRHLKSDFGGVLSDAQVRKYEEALQIARDMEAWCKRDENASVPMSAVRRLLEDAACHFAPAGTPSSRPAYINAYVNKRLVALKVDLKLQESCEPKVTNPCPDCGREMKHLMQDGGMHTQKLTRSEQLLVCSYCRLRYVVTIYRDADHKV